VKHLLVTGGAGFVGHHLVEHALETTDWRVTALVSFRHRGCPRRLAHLQGHPQLSIVWHDLRGPVTLQLAHEIGPVDYIVHAAAESHVDRSIADPVPFVRNNVDVTLNLLEYARLVHPSVVIQISTDEVYGPAAPDVDHVEWFPIIPSNPYSASKAAQEAIAISYWRTYGLPVVLTNTMNNFGERQDQEKFTPMVISHLLRGVPIPARSPEWEQGTRFWLHARDHADALLHLCRLAPDTFPASDRPARWHIVGEVELASSEMAMAIADAMGIRLRYEIVSRSAEHRPGHDLRYALDGHKLAATGWEAPLGFGRGLERVAAWAKANPHWLTLGAEPVRSG